LATVRGTNDQLVQDVLFELWGIKHFLVELLAHLLTHAVQLVALCVFPFLLGERMAGHLGDGICVFAEQLDAADTDQHKGRHNQERQDNLHQLLMRTYEIKHVSYCFPRVEALKLLARFYRAVAPIANESK
jgi:hypothetical protein